MMPKIPLRHEIANAKQQQQKPQQAPARDTTGPDGRLGVTPPNRPVR